MPKYDSMVVFHSQVEKRRQFAWKRIAFVLATIIVCVGGWVVWQYTQPLDLFTLEHVRIEGNHRVSNEEIRNVLGLHTGTGLFYLNLGQLEHKIGKIIWVKSAKIHRTLPDILTVHIDEYDPTAVLVRDKLYLVGSEGHLLPPPPPGYVVNLPVITNYTGPIPAFGVKVADPGFQSAVAVLADMKQYRLFTRINEVRFTSSYRYQLFMDDGKIELLLGKKRRESISAVECFLKNIPTGLNWNEIAYIDARTPGFIALNNQTLQSVLSKPESGVVPRHPDNGI